MRIFLKSFVLILIFGILVAHSQTLSRAEDYYGRGVGRLEHGDLDGALADLNKAIEMLPKYSAAITARGAVKRAQGDLEGALIDYGRAIELTPDIAIPYYSRGFILLESKDFDGAIKDFDKALEDSPIWPSSIAIEPTPSGPKEMPPAQSLTTARRLRSNRKTRRSTSNAAPSGKHKRTSTARSLTLVDRKSVV